MKEILVQYVAYNIWANEKMVSAIARLEQDQLQQTVESSFPSLYSTLLHMWDAESIWWQRMKLQENIKRPSDTPNLSFNEVASGLAYQNKQWFDWISTSTEAALDHVFAYQNSKKEQFKQPMFQMLLHMFNHATYHRGQLVNILHQIGIHNIPPTDFIIFSRKK